MGHAVVQTEIGPVTAEQVTRAFAAVPALGRANATTYAVCPTGIFADGLKADAAQRLLRALTQEGVSATVIDDAALPPLPQRVVLQRLDCLPEALVLYDPLGRPRQVGWPSVAIVAAGNVAVVEFERQERSQWIAAGDAELPASDVTYQEKSACRLMLTVLLADRAHAYQAEGDRLHYTYLGARLTQNRTANFLHVVRDLVALAPHGALNRGAAVVRAGHAQLPPYGSRQAFGREIRWLMWWRGAR